ncbi:hypothetical protein TREMEDRAFT_69686 [Tremella mesenterica DSM 1558]|uniref:uncharacterized protein n=1 Tax=Tremella mesenterica (strain ATCC 24925 / CBS 8224 / DSM 1558 / NBRC 9311 / NRRL Y-6157 / RJB 2259-6 / UBC 559-6) TaxID=578456 RepID=UPI0003F49261|nr:uncharacterized protein TREMEDRAFT_69686 [Tremella mesenterica DSM 1558]EIW67704.1 hypothetical protein TREMEDRAFT_69686 [Tremella mesenterica DSM 1558]
MEVDHVESHGTEQQADSVQQLDHSVEDAANELGELLVKLDLQPLSVPLLSRQICLLRRLGMIEEALEARLKLSSLIMLDQDTWLSYFDDLFESSVQPVTLDVFVEMLERFDQAEKDYLSSAVLVRHVEFILRCTSHLYPPPEDSQLSKPSISVEADVAEFLSEETVRGMLQGVVQRGNQLLGESHLLWQPWIDWELDLMKTKIDEEQRSSHIDRIHAAYLDRMTVPHSTLDATSSSYSSFCSQYAPNTYEQRLINATNAAQNAKFKWNGEKRHGKTREDLEQELAYAPDITAQLQTFASYISWETDQHAKHPKIPGKSPATDVFLTRGVFERTIATYGRIVAALQSTIITTPPPSTASEMENTAKKGKGKAKSTREIEKARREETEATTQVTIQAYREAEAGIWSQFAAWLEANGHSDAVQDIKSRGARACPEVGSIWCSLLTHMECHGAALEDLTTTFEKAINLGTLGRKGVPCTALVDVFLHRAAFESRAEPVEDVEGDYHPVIQTLSRGLEAVVKFSQAGDPSLRLEKFLLDWAESRAPKFLNETISLLSKPSKSRLSSYQMTILRSGIETRRGNIEEARNLFTTALQRSDLDWPEAVYEAFIQFENVHGDLDTVLDANKRIAKAQEKLAKRREKAAQEQTAQYQVVAQSGTSATTAELLVPSTAVAVDGQGLSTAAPVTTAQASTSQEAENTPLKRQCGPIRETTILSEHEHDHIAALVEFRDVDSIPDALTRDRKKLAGNEVAVSMLWRSTLFITNFPRSMDDAGIRQLLSSYGLILQTRWPSRKYADSRRFCYVTMDSPASAQNALQLHGQPTTEGFNLTVLISDPSAKARRSDTSKTTLFVGGLTAKSTAPDVEKLFSQRGAVQHVNLGWDQAKQICKGFAFVEMATEADAQEALNLHGSHINGRYLKVEMHDPNHVTKKRTTSAPREAIERRARTVRLSNLPSDTQEGLLQQALEKIVSVKRLELFSKVHQAVVELESQVDAGLLLLQSEPFIFGGATIEIREEQRRPLPHKSDHTPPAAGQATVAPSTSLSFAPRAARRGGKAIGKGRQAPPQDKSLHPSFVKASTHSNNETDSGQVDFRAIVAAKNKQRQGKLLEARHEQSVGGESQNGVKRSPEEASEAPGAKRSKN